MSETFKRLRKNRGTEVDIEDDKFHLRNMMIGELRRVDALPIELKPGFIVGCKLCTDDGAGPALPQQEGENDQDWATRVMTEIADVSTAKIAAIVTWSPKVPKTDDIVKN
jgi:hypothetical protein